MDKRCIAFCYLSSIGILSNRLMMTGPFAQTSDGLFIKSLQGVLQGEGRTNDGQHNVVAGGKRIEGTCIRVNGTVTVPELSDISKPGISRRQVVALKVSLRLVTPHDVPLGVGVEGIHFRTGVVFYAGGLGGVPERLRSRV